MSPGALRIAHGGVLRGAIWGQRRRVAIGSALLIAHQAGEAMVPVIVGATIDRAIVTGDAGALGVWLGVLAVTFAVLSVSYRFGDRFVERASQTAAHDLRLALTRRILHPRGGAAEGRPSGGLLSIATSDASRVGEVNVVIGVGASAVAGITVAAAALLQISLVLGALVLVGLPPLLVLIHLLGRPLVRRAASEQAEAAGATGVAADLIAGLRVLKGIGAESAAIERYRDSSRRSLAATLRAAGAEATVAGVGILLTGAFLALVALIGGRLVADGRIELGEFIAAVGLTGFLTGPLSLSSYVVLDLARGRASAGRVAGLLDSPVAVTGGTRAPSPPPAGAVALRDVRHRGLDGLNLEISAGEHAAIVATDAADGAALVELLARAADPQAGSVQLDGVAYTELDPDLLRAVVRVSAHDAELFDGSLSDNLRAAAPGERVDAALVAADVADVVAALPGGLDATLGERGRSLSGGQRQRVALARALAADAAVLVLHDPTTAVDAVTEARIAARVRDLRAGQTTIVVTSSPALLAAADRVVLLAGGRAGATGSHMQLMHRDAHYRAAVLA
ncbi:MAG: ABC transporter ATP-binding protein/permease [Solirubrobacteraceae bacterium MAG38_C4-C5]|nr:ABC transporter ATP-binding protein/permease [Candidatus Siliceabacter maunaloa]